MEHSVLKNRTAFSEVPLLPENFYSNDPNGLVPFILQPDFLEFFFVNGKQPFLISFGDEILHGHPSRAKV